MLFAIYRKAYFDVKDFKNLWVNIQMVFQPQKLQSSNREYAVALIVFKGLTYDSLQRVDIQRVDICKQSQKVVQTPFRHLFKRYIFT